MTKKKLVHQPSNPIIKVSLPRKQKIPAEIFAIADELAAQVAPAYSVKGIEAVIGAVKLAAALYLDKVKNQNG